MELYKQNVELNTTVQVSDTTKVKCLFCRSPKKYVISLIDLIHFSNP